MKKLNLKKLRFSFKLENLLSFLPYLTVTLSIVASGYAAWFIYTNIIISANEAVELQIISQDVVQTRLNTSLFEEVNSDYSNKSSSDALDINSLKNPFIINAMLSDTASEEQQPTQEDENLIEQ